MKYRKKPEHNDANYLRAILESLVEYNAIARLDIANLLHVGYKKAVKDPTKHAADTLVLEMLSKFMQALEDLCMLCVMFEDPSVGNQRWEMYIKVSNQQILRFLLKARKGKLSDKAIRSIYGLKSAREYSQAGEINKEEIPGFEQIIRREVESYKKTLASIANAYAGEKVRGKDSVRPSILLKIYFLTKHGFKIIHPTPTAIKVWNTNKGDISMPTTIRKWRWGRKMLGITSFPKFTEAGVYLLMERIKGWSELTGQIARLQLKNLDNPYWLVPHIRLFRTEDLLKIQPKPNRNDDCLCGSKMKFKKCCELLLK